MSKSRVQDSPDSECVVCCRNVSIYAIGECDHPVCHDCATRMRVLCRQNECPICRRELPKVIFSRQLKPYVDVAYVAYPLQDKKYMLYFEDESIQQAYNGLLEHRCRMCKGKAFNTFSQLKDHVRREHELHFCDLCVKHLMIFSYERKLYTRSDLARHRRQGDPDDTSHRGHPLCEFCDERYLDNDELFRHLRKDHFFCHFCDANGLHHYYCDYEYLREHFRVEHFLCEEGECRGERFTTVFNSEIDIKAHRATVHNKGMTKSQAKQARTLELEFTIAPRGMTTAASGGSTTSATNGRSGQENVTFNDGDPHRRRTPREEYAATQGMDISQTIGNKRPEEHRGARANQRHGYEDNNRPRLTRRVYDDAPNMIVTVAPNLDVSSRSDFPTLGGMARAPATATRTEPARRPGTASSAPATPPTFNSSSRAAEHSGGGAALNSDTLARKLAKINRFTVGTAEIGAVDEFPALNPVATVQQQRAQNQPSFFSSTKGGGGGTAKPGLWASSSGSATLSVTSSSQSPVAALAAEARRTKNTLTLKLNSQEEFPGLVENRRSRQQQEPPQQRQTPKVSIQLSHKQSTAPSRTQPSSSQRRKSDAAAPPTNTSSLTNGQQREMWRPVVGKDSRGSGARGEVQPVVTNMSASQNITFINPPGGAKHNASKGARRHESDESPSPPSEEAFPQLSTIDGRGGGAKNTAANDGGWYVLKKSGKSTKLDSPPDERPSEFVGNSEADFPVLEKKGRLLRPGFGGVVPGEAGAGAWKKGGTDETGSGASSTVDSLPQTKTKSKKKKSKSTTNNNSDDVAKVVGGADKSSGSKNDKNLKVTETAGNSAGGSSKATASTSKKEDKEKKQTPSAKKNDDSMVKKSEDTTAPTKKKENSVAKKSEESSAKRNDGSNAKKGHDGASSKKNDVATTKKSDDTASKKNDDASGAKKNDEPSGKKASKRTELTVTPLAAPKVKETKISSSKTTVVKAEKSDTATVEILNSDSNFPSLLSSLKPVTAPPGFNNVSTITATTTKVAPPPGFRSPPAAAPATTYPANPPPGFRVPVGNGIAPGQSPTSPTSVTFTSSSGQNYSILTPPATPYSAYEPPDRFQARSLELTDKLRTTLEEEGVAGSGDDRFATFKLLSGRFRQGVTSGADYYEQCVRLMGRDKFQSVFAELLVLLPDIAKQRELLAAHKAFVATSPSKKTVDPFLVCASCQQVLTGKDFRTHENSHSLIDDFPSLDERLPAQAASLMSQVTWVKRS